MTDLLMIKLAEIADQESSNFTGMSSNKIDSESQIKHEKSSLRSDSNHELEKLNENLKRIEDPNRSFRNSNGSGEIINGRSTFTDQDDNGPMSPIVEEEIYS